ncbi:hydrolase [Psychrobium sp. 1_MG-2023]|uniref:hydrolase n=1 Tax=Psychrobium sp. 1_MG-2023 TaxID=3062624 RepID=UPI000C31D75B|nr:hydrolase [Psychrobium sp. 1_MG-2023]MDP2560817.1 hydrolase [Psychrobium sp. 1_MG-2023]PKF56692.1 hydrolase [Alteromonadales bacterium alter-6D02]
MHKPSKFKPAWWARNPHVQTIFADLLTSRNKPLGTNQRLELDDGDFVDLVWTDEINQDYQGPLVVLFHGLEGSLKSHYAYRLLKSLKQHQWPGVMMHFRGCSGEPNRLPRAYHSGETDDPRFFIEYLTKRFPKARLYAVGYSLGGNMLLKYLGKYQDDSLITAAVSISPPLDLSACEKRLKTGFSRVYQTHLLKRMKRNLKKKLQQMPELSQHILCGHNLNLITNFKSFDQLVTAPLHGFDNADDYYQKSSAMQYLKTISVPSLILHAADDPFMTHAVIPEHSQLSNNIEYELCAKGGHVGFIEGKYPWRPKFYIEQRIAEFFKQLDAAF